MYGWSVAGVYMKNLIRRLFGRLYAVNYSDVLNYRGSWRKGLFNGYGVLEYKSGGVYEGNFRLGAKHGFGIFNSASGFQYAGDWANGNQTGSAKIFYKNGDWYQGLVNNGVRCGFGELFEKSSQRVFKGQWSNGNLTDEVQITSKDWTYSGTAPDRHGRASGSLIYSDGSTYVGNITNFIRHGIGKFTSKAGNQIAGCWLDNTSVHYATSTDSEGIQWYGTLKNLKPQGFMKVRLPNGQKYDGVWLNGNLQRALSVRNKRNAEPIYHFH
jgi:hypothetical protein